MKKVLIALTMLLALTGSAGAASQKHRHTPQVEQTDSTRQEDAVEAYSDTTEAASIADAQAQGQYYQMDDEDVENIIKDALSDVSGKDLTALLLIPLVLLILFVLAPVLIIIAVFYFLRKNRKDRMQLAQMAIQNGQPIPEQLLNGKKGDDEWDNTSYQAGMRQCFVGIGLAIFLGYVAGKIGFGIGALIFFIGLGKVVAAKTGGKKRENNDNSINNVNE